MTRMLLRESCGQSRLEVSCVPSVSPDEVHSGVMSAITAWQYHYADEHSRRRRVISTSLSEAHTSRDVCTMTIQSCGGQRSLWAFAEWTEM